MMTVIKGWIAKHMQLVIFPENSHRFRTYQAVVIYITALNKEIYTELCVPCDPTGTDVYMGVELPISAVRQHPEKFPNVRRLAESDDFFMMQEYNNVKAYYEKLRRRIQDEEDSDDLFDQGAQ